MSVPSQENTHLSSWGNYPVVTTNTSRPERYDDLFGIEGPYIARGLGRSYGDAALLSNGTVVMAERLDRMLRFDEVSGVVTAEAGLSLETLLQYFVPKGWFVPVTPGTKFATLGGCVAADVHGKNHHHDGSFGAHVQEIELILPDGTARRCSPNKDSELFWATVGGMGLTGIISEVSLKLMPIETSYIVENHQTAPDLDSMMKLLQEGGTDDKYSVAWIDCLASGASLGRSVLLLGHHAKLDELPVKLRDKPLIAKHNAYASVPMMMPFSLINRFSVQMFNSLYYRFQGNVRHVTPYDPFCYPLDAIGNWNRIYGKRGFVQYQFVVPSLGAEESMKVILEKLASSKRASFLAVLKRFGKQGPGLLSFPFEGYTLALDIPITDDGLFSLLTELDEMVLRYNGRVYLAKDARLTPETFRAMYPRYSDFAKIKSQVDPTGIIRSDLSQRLRIGDF